MGKKITQKALSAAIKAFNNKCPHCTNGKIGKATCGYCRGSGTKK